MLRKRLPVCCLALAALLVLPSAARAETLADALKRQEALSRLVEQWITLSERDPREDDLEAYSKYQDEDWGKRGRVKAEDLAKILADPAADKDLRQRAAKELEKAAIATRDPDLAPDKRGDVTKRKNFAKKHLLELIKRSDEKGGDALGRGLAYKLLSTWFSTGGGKDASDVTNYDPAASKEDTWAPAHRALRDALNR